VPFTTGTKTVTVNLLDPTLLALEVVLILVTFAWLYVGGRELPLRVPPGEADQGGTGEGERDRDQAGSTRNLTPELA